MKKIALILIVLLASVASYSQSAYAYIDTLDISTISGADTTIFIPFRSEDGSGVTFDFTSLSADDGTLDFGYSNDKINFTSIDDTRNPFTLSTATYTKTVAGVAKSRIGFRADKWSYKYIAYKYTKGSSTTGDLIITWVR